MSVYAKCRSTAALWSPYIWDFLRDYQEQIAKKTLGYKSFWLCLQIFLVSVEPSNQNKRIDPRSFERFLKDAGCWSVSYNKHLKGLLERWNKGESLGRPWLLENRWRNMDNFELPDEEDTWTRQVTEVKGIEIIRMKCNIVNRYPIEEYSPRIIFDSPWF